MKNKPLLTLAIPTYNRAYVLDNTLNMIVNDEAFCDDIEIVISDNCSTDNTYNVVEKYRKKYFKSIIYNRNDENIFDKNFLYVMSLGSGKYIKLMNDTAVFIPGSLRFLLEHVRKHLLDHSCFFIVANTMKHKNMCICTKGLDEFITHLSFSSTWIGNVGIWRDDFERIENKEECVELQLFQLDLFLKYLYSKKEYFIYFHSLYEIKTATKGGYSIFKVFVENYLTILNSYRKKGIGITSIYIEKFYLYVLFIYPRLVLTLRKDELFLTFDSHDAFGIVFTHYKYHFYFYFSLLFLPFKKMIKKIYKL